MVTDMDTDLLSERDPNTAIFYQTYQPMEVLGRGVSSVVRRMLYRKSGQSFAVKIIDVSKDIVDADGLNLREQTMREINILRLVGGHENVIELLDVFDTPTYVFLVFELCVNGELFDHLEREERFSEKKARRIMKQVFEALKHCHSKGVIHRDIKMENILLDEDQNIKLTDFGFAKILQPRERLYDLCGTPGYLAPELLKAGMMERDESEGYGLEVDVWACGVTLYTLLAGYPPFWNRAQIKMVRQIMEGRYDFDDDKWKEDKISQYARDLISKILVLDTQRRLTVDQCLSHEFFFPLVRKMSNTSERLKQPPSSCNPRKKWTLVIRAVQFVIRLRKLKESPEKPSLKVAASSPYKMRPFRKVLDSAAFKVYGHWVKKIPCQNRAAMFELAPKRIPDKKEKTEFDMETS